MERMPQGELRWRADEFEYREKSSSWYWASIGIAVAALAFAAWQRNFLFGFFVVIAEILILVWAGKEPQTKEFQMSEKGLEIMGHKLYPWNNLDAFSVDEEESRFPYLTFKFKKKIHLTLRVGVPREPGARGNIIAYAETYVPRVERARSPLDDLENFLKF